MRKLKYWLELIASPSRLLYALRIWWLRSKGITISNKADIRFPLYYRHPENIVLDNAVIGERTLLVAGSHSLLYIAENSLLAPNVHINCTAHIYEDRKTSTNFGTILKYGI